MMRKGFIDNRLRFSCSRPWRRRGAFTLTELVVSIGILVLMFSLAGQVFTVTVKSTGQANAVTEVSQLLRVFEQTLREDLRHVQPGQSLLVIQGNPVNAYWTDQGREADDDGDPSNGYPHPRDPQREHRDPDTGAVVMDKPRADVLMFFAARKGQSFVDPAVTSNLQQVVYGHAELGDYEFVAGSGSSPGTWQFVPPTNPAFPSDDTNNDYPSPSIPSSVPSWDWHLARRSVVLVPSPLPTDNPPPAVGGWVDGLNVMGDYDPGSLANVSIIRGDSDIVANFDFDQFVLRPALFVPAPNGNPYFLSPVLSYALFDTNPPYNPVTVPFRRSELDPTPPPQLPNGLGHYFLPNCASFKVEWALDARGEFVDGRLDGQREVFWFDPGVEPDLTANPRVHPLSTLEAVADDPVLDPSGDVSSLLGERTLHPDKGQYSLADRFVGRGFDGNVADAWPPLGADGRMNLVAFGIDRPKEGMTVNDPIVRVPDDIFPSALRITIDVYDGGRRLAKPIRHVMIVPLGG